jgi:hypothetical protein
LHVVAARAVEARASVERMKVGSMARGATVGAARGVEVVVEVVEIFVVVVLSEGGGPILFRRKRDVFPGDETRASARRGRIEERIEKRAM